MLSTFGPSSLADAPAVRIALRPNAQPVELGPIDPGEVKTWVTSYVDVHAETHEFPQEEFLEPSFPGHRAFVVNNPLFANVNGLRLPLREGSEVPIARMAGAVIDSMGSAPFREGVLIRLAGPVVSIPLRFENRPGPRPAPPDVVTATTTPPPALVPPSLTPNVAAMPQHLTMRSGGSTEVHVPLGREAASPITTTLTPQTSAVVATLTTTLGEYATAAAVTAPSAGQVSANGVSPDIEAGEGAIDVPAADSSAMPLLAAGLLTPKGTLDLAAIENAVQRLLGRADADLSDDGDQGIAPVPVLVAALAAEGLRRWRKRSRGLTNAFPRSSRSVPFPFS